MAEEGRQRCLWTGFGAFGAASERVEKNPSAVLCHSCCQENDESRMVEVSMSDSSALVEYAKSHNFSVVIHLGLSQLAKKITLEKCSYNESNFRCPDETGAQPRNCKIDQSTQVLSLNTNIDVDAVADQIRKRGFDVEVSSDPGRFVCNYLYFCSLRAQTAPQILFVHIPPFNVLAQETQEATLKALRDILLVGTRDSPLLAALYDLGIDRERAQAAVRANCANVDAAMNFIFSGSLPDDNTTMTVRVDNSISLPQPPKIDEVKLLLIVRTDLAMSSGKVAAQTSHAALGAYRLALETDPALAFSWLDTFAEKIVVCAAPSGTKPQLDFILSTQRAAQGAGLVSFLVRDAGRTEVDPGSPTVLALGPALSSRLDPLTRHLRLL